jgi:hypothetical protein
LATKKYLTLYVEKSIRYSKNIAGIFALLSCSDFEKFEFQRIASSYFPTKFIPIYSPCSGLNPEKPA